MKNKKNKIFKETFFPKNKKASHVGFAIAFVIFISFLIFFYAMFKPAIRIGDDKKVILKQLENKIIKNVSADLITISIKKDSLENCSKINLSSLNISYTNFTVRNNQGIINSNLSLGNLIVENKSNFFKIYASNESFNLSENHLCTSFSNYTVGLIRTEKYIFETKVIWLINYYNNSYETLKDDFEISDINDFSFSFIYNNNTEIKTNEKNVSISVYADSIPINYINKNASIEVGYIKIKIW